MADVEVRWDNGWMREFFLSDWMLEQCEKHAREYVGACAATINSRSHSPMKEPCGCEGRRLDRTCVGVVFAKTKGAAAVARKYGIK